jgi:hypothetical protein
MSAILSPFLELGYCVKMEDDTSVWCTGLRHDLAEVVCNYLASICVYALTFGRVPLQLGESLVAAKSAPVIDSSQIPVVLSKQQATRTRTF